MTFTVDLTQIPTWLIIAAPITLNVLYGLLTHMHATKEVGKWNKLEQGNRNDDQWKSRGGKDQVEDYELALLMVYRITMGLLGRIAILIVGIVLWTILLVATGKSRMNMVLYWAARWHQPPWEIEI